MTSTTRRRHRYQCSKRDCRARFALKRKIEDYHPTYRKRLGCPSCGSKVFHSIEALRRRELAKQDRCWSNACPMGRYFPHQKGSSIFCMAHPDFDPDSWTREEEERYARIEQTERSG